MSSSSGEFARSMWTAGAATPSQRFNGGRLDILRFLWRVSTLRYSTALLQLKTNQKNLEKESKEEI